MASHMEAKAEVVIDQVPKTISTVKDLSNEWLSSVLGAEIISFQSERIGAGQVAQCHRIHLQYAVSGKGPATVVSKLASGDTTSFVTASSGRLYEREVKFYAEVSPLLKSPVIPHCYHASFDEDRATFCLILEDRHGETGNEISGANLEQARIAVVELAKLRTKAEEVITLDKVEWLNKNLPIPRAFLEPLWSEYWDRYSHRISPEHRRICEVVWERYESYEERTKWMGEEGLTHCDWRLDNMIFGSKESSTPFTIVDWQTLAWGNPFRDLSYFLGVALPTDLRRQYDEELLGLYHSTLGPESRFSLQQVKDGVRGQIFAGLLMTIFSPMVVERHERGDDMFMVMLARHCEHITDRKALELLSEPAKLVPLRPQVADEFIHPATKERLYSESWYFDATDPEQDIGVWVRLGLTPNQEGSWYTALVCGAGRPTVAVVDYKVPTPGADLVVHSDTIHATHVAEDPLVKYHVTLDGKGQSYGDPAMLLAGKSGQATEVKLDLVWHTEGDPYTWRIAARYEIPCKVTGTIAIDGKTITLNGCMGQRDHSWGPRDWWALDWVWSAFHLEDGTHIHAVELRPPGYGSLGVGYIQSAKDGLTELTKVHAVEEVAASGLPLSTKMELSPGNPSSLDLKLVGHAPLRLVAEDGRVCLFPRAWVKVTTGDGRQGVGWIEWNLNQTRK